MFLKLLLYNLVHLPATLNILKPSNQLKAGCSAGAGAACVNFWTSTSLPRITPPHGQTSGVSRKSWSWLSGAQIAETCWLQINSQLSAQIAECHGWLLIWKMVPTWCQRPSALACRDTTGMPGFYAHLQDAAGDDSGALESRLRQCRVLQAPDLGHHFSYVFCLNLGPWIIGFIVQLHHV